MLATKPPGGGNAWRQAWQAYTWKEKLRLTGSIALLALVALIAFERIYAISCDQSQPLCGFIPGVRASPPPPPPPLERAVLVARNATAGAVAYAKKNPYKIAAYVGGLFLADLVNLAIVIDKLDPVVRLVNFVAKPIRSAAAFVWQLLLRHRADALLTAATGLVR